MIIGILKEIKTEENRVSMTPAGVEVMIQNGHTLLVEKDGGQGSGNPCVYLGCIQSQVFRSESDIRGDRFPDYLAVRVLEHHANQLPGTLYIPGNRHAGNLYPSLLRQQ